MCEAPLRQGPRPSHEGAGFCSHSSRRKVACNVPPPRGGQAGIPARLCLTQRPRHRAGPVPASTGCTFHNDTTAVPPESQTLLHSTQFSVMEVGFLSLRLPHPCTHHTGTRPRELSTAPRAEAHGRPAPPRPRLTPASPLPRQRSVPGPASCVVPRRSQSPSRLPERSPPCSTLVKLPGGGPLAAPASCLELDAGMSIQHPRRLHL